MNPVLNLFPSCKRSNDYKVSTGLKSVAKILNSKVINEENQDQFEVMIVIV